MPRRPSSPPPPPITSPQELFAYSAEHLTYEVGMLFGAIESRYATLQSPEESLMQFFQNARVEAFGNHFRNLVVFLFPDDYPLMADDVAAHHFVTTADPIGRWKDQRGPLSATLRSAKTRADKEMAHLTVRRLARSHPDKPWDVVALGEEIRTLLKAFVAIADPACLSDSVGKAIPD
jgi:hypothetical protein